MSKYDKLTFGVGVPSFKINFYDLSVLPYYIVGGTNVSV